MKTARRIALGLVFLIASGCAQRADWIADTLVTVDVTGHWTGQMLGAPGGHFDLTLQQTGPKATGDLKLLSPHGHLWSGPIDGTVNGDALTFSRYDGTVRAEVIVAGDEMSGTVILAPFAAYSGGLRTLRLQRQP